MQCFKYFNLLIFSLTLAGCIGAKKAPSSTYEEMSQTLQGKEQNIENLKFKNEILQRKVAEFKKPVVRRLPGRLTEETMYIEVIKNFRIRDTDGVVWAKDQMLKHFPKSPFADNAIYLSGQIMLEEGYYSEALKEYQQLIDKYPQGNKVPAAFLGKGIAYRKLNLFPYAESALRTVKKDFPGSPESQRVELEMKLLGVQREG
jgi:outer membrane protein assembly factor BamD (BamD/ComL family)